MSKNISRREFIKTMGVAGIATAGLSSCVGTKKETKELPEGDVPKDKMTYRVNPTTGDKVSILGFGMMRLPTKEQPEKNENEEVNEEIDQEEVNKLVDYALDHGVNYFDTSPVYCQGLSERATGLALSRHPRNKFFVATKLSNFSPDTQSREASIAMYRNSLKELRVDYIDYMLLHAIGGGRDAMAEYAARYVNNGILDFLIEERKAGRIRNLGFSYHGDIRVFDYLLSKHDEYKWDFVQIQLNYLDWRHAKITNPANTDAEYLYAELAKRNIPAVIMEPLLGGRLSKVPGKVAAYLLQREPGKSVASWAFRFAGTMPGVLTVLSGMTRMEHLQDNIRTYSPLKPLNDDELAFLEEAAKIMIQFGNIPCNDCKYCMPCPYGIDIPATLLYYNKCLNEDRMPVGAQNENYRKARREFLAGYDKSVPRLRQANHCIGCGKCVDHCPQRINIPRELHRIDAYVERLRQSINHID